MVMGSIHLGYYKYVMGVYWNISKKKPTKQKKIGSFLSLL